MLLHFILATSLITLLPGPSLLLIVLQAVRHGLPGSLLVIAGVVLADGLLLLAVFSGLGALLYASALIFSLMKWLGIGWLLWLGLQQLRDTAQHATATVRSSGHAFSLGLTTTLLNPKIIKDPLNKLFALRLKAKGLAARRATQVVVILRTKEPNAADRPFAFKP